MKRPSTGAMLFQKSNPFWGLLNPTVWDVE
jgi:hypothetical protein